MDMKLLPTLTHTMSTDRVAMLADMRMLRKSPAGHTDCKQARFQQNCATSCDNSPYFCPLSPHAELCITQADVFHHPKLTRTS